MGHVGRELDYKSLAADRMPHPPSIPTAMPPMTHTKANWQHIRHQQAAVTAALLHLTAALWSDSLCVRPYTPLL